MKKLQKMLSVLLILVMLLTLAACGGKDSGKGDNATEPANDNPYNLDYESTEIQPMSDERASMETLVEAKTEYFRDLNLFTDTDLETLTYQDVVEHIGVEPSAYQYEATNGRRIYFWFVEDSTGPWLSVYFNADGTLYGSGSANIR